MTSQDKFDRYNKILEGQPIESRLFASMIEHLASEIVASGAASIQHLMHWVKSTFMFTRMLKNPVAYFGHWANSERIELEMEEKLKELVKQLVDNVRRRRNTRAGKPSQRRDARFAHSCFWSFALRFAPLSSASWSFSPSKACSVAPALRF